MAPRLPLKWLGRSCVRAGASLQPHAQLLAPRACTSGAWSLRGAAGHTCCRGCRHFSGRALRLSCRAAASVEEAPQLQWRQEQVEGRNIVEVLRSRGLVHDIAGAHLEAAAGRQQLTVYCGFDPTAESLHIGHLLGILVLRWFQRCGHRTVGLLGGATGRVGDPSGRSAERPVLSEEEIGRNVAGIRAILERLLQPAGGSGLAPPTILNNLDWFGGMGFLHFLREVGKHARVNVMLSRESVRQRLQREEGISFTEFTYQLLQGYDYVHLHREHGVNVQLGGSDQMGNILSGLDLVRRLSDAPTPPACYGLCVPLLTNSEGVKMGKSAAGAVWLAPDKLSPFKFYQYLLTTTADADVGRFLRMLTGVAVADIEALEAAMAAPGYVPNTAQRLLAAEVTRFVHGPEGLRQAEEATQALAPGSDTRLDAAALEAIAEEAPSARLPRAQVVGCALADVLAAVGLQPSKSAARRLIKGGGVRVNNQKAADEGQTLAESDLIEGRLVLLAAGKKNKLLLHVS